MVEPHVFCGPEFVLEVPAARAAEVLAPAGGAPALSPTPATNNAAAAAWSVPPSTLLRMQSELYGVCTPALRWRLHRPTLTSAEGGRAVEAADVRAVASLMVPYAGEESGSAVQRRTAAPAPPTEVRYLSAKATHALTPEEEASLAQTVKLITKASTSGSTNQPDTQDRGASGRGGGDDSPSPPAPSLTPVYALVLVTDSRMAGELYMLCLRNGSIALSEGCRLYNYYRATARAAAIDPADILAKKEAMRSRHNLDADLWSALELAVTPERVEQVVAARQRADEASHRYPPGRLLTTREAHQQRVEALLAYCESHVTYAGVLDRREEASPLLIAMGLFFRLRLTEVDLYRAFARHPRRAVRALALLLARYILAPEELPPFFYAALHDGVVIATSEDGSATCTMAAFAERALTSDEVGEAWLPVYHPLYVETVVTPAVRRMAWLWEQCQLAQQQQRHTGAVGLGSAGDAGSDTEWEDDGVPKLRAPALDDEGERPTGPGTAGGADAIRGSGRGVAAFGFKSLQALGAHVRQQERSLVPQRLTTLLAARHTRNEALAFLHRDGGGGGPRTEGWSGSEPPSGDSDDDDFLIQVEVETAAGAGAASTRDGRRARREGRPAGGEGQPAPAPEGVSLAPVTAKRRREEERLDPHAAILKEGYRVVLELLGRRQPFNRKDERYLEF